MQKCTEFYDFHGIFSIIAVVLTLSRSFKGGTTLNSRDESFARAKGGLISESFSLWLKSPKMVSNHVPGHYIPQEKMLRGVIWHPFLEF